MKVENDDFEIGILVLYWVMIFFAVTLMLCGSASALIYAFNKFNVCFIR